MRISRIIPADDWKKHGVWQNTLVKELRTLPQDTPIMCVKSTYGGLLGKYPFIFDIHMHERSGQWCPLAKFSGYEYCWKSTDGRGLDELNIHGPFDRVVLFKIIETFEGAGLILRDRWDLVIVFGQ